MFLYLFGKSHHCMPISDHLFPTFPVFLFLVPHACVLEDYSAAVCCCLSVLSPLSGIRTKLDSWILQEINLLMKKEILVHMHFQHEIWGLFNSPFSSHFSPTSHISA